MHRSHLVLALGLAALPIAARAQQATAHIPVESYTLPNGLTVLLSVDHTAPVVAVDVEHHVGSKNEEVGRTGFAHLFEHVMFTGSGHVPYGMHDKFTEGFGGSNKGSTNSDKTNFYESVPSNYLETEIWLEADRLGWLLDALDIAKLNAQRDIVKNERRQSYDNQPYGRVSEIMDAQMYPEGHPYHWPVIGSMSDLSAASEMDVRAFFIKWYGPNNTVLVIAGDFDPAQAKTLGAEVFSARSRRGRRSPVRWCRQRISRRTKALCVRGQRCAATVLHQLARRGRHLRRSRGPERDGRDHQRRPDAVAHADLCLRPEVGLVGLAAGSGTNENVSATSISSVVAKPGCRSHQDGERDRFGDRTLQAGWPDPRADEEGDREHRIRFVQPVAVDARQGDDARERMDLPR